ncbi:hypothetical protein D0469_01810 [Peribacillus saganii]|uniref:Flagellar hook-length control protein-like C-terminal domain-containing protein n=1 Tax=Peribacillus saganii TaxID=2303992 RepID=A0A372LSU5_9BACI|nr:hypothetical protein [Peribacillus saganii]RFU71269.1 hypothetical protein D0469_01810 [Peribacillus saganii]
MQRANGIQLNPQSGSPQKDISFRSGQIIYGKVNKINPNHTAEVQIGSMKITAALDAPLQTGRKYWLQVQPGEGTIKLKRMASPSGHEAASIKSTVEQLVSRLGMPRNKESLELAQFLLKNQLPVRKDTFQAALEWIKGSEASTQHGLNTVKTMHIQNLPFIKNVFQALLSIEEGKPFHTLLAGLAEQLDKSGESTDTALQIRNLISQQIQPEKNRISSDALQRLITAWASGESTAEKQQSAFRVLLAAGFVDKNITEAEFAESFVQKAQASPLAANPSSRLAEGLTLISQYSRAMKQNNLPLANQALEAFGRLMSGVLNLNDGPNQPNGIMTETGTFTLTAAQGIKRPGDPASDAGKPIGAQGAVPHAPAEQAVRMVKQLIMAYTADDRGPLTLNAKGQSIVQLEALFASIQGVKTISEAKDSLSNMIGALSESGTRANGIAGLAFQDSELLMSLSDWELNSSDFSNGTFVRDFIQKLSKMLGLDMESYLAASFGKEDSAASEELLSLKPLLLKLLNENQPYTVKEAAEQALHRLTAQQLLSSDAGPLQNLVMQIPLAMENHRSDLTIQWSGRKKSDGSIDPSYCRILFYLDLANIKETVIDLQIQNKVIKVTVYNESAEQLKPLLDAFLPVLKHNLEEMGYMLSSVGFEPSADRNNPVSRQLSPLSVHTDSYSGVDLRI